MLFVFPALRPVWGQSGNLPEYQHLSPLPFSTGHNPETTITIKYGMEIDRNSVDGKYFELLGEISGSHNISLRLAGNNKSLIIIPEQHFILNERVHIRMSEGIRGVNGLTLPVIDYWFRVRESQVEIKHRSEPTESEMLPFSSTLKSVSEIPEVKISRLEDPAAGYIFCTFTGKAYNFLYAFDNYGTPVFYLEFPYPVYNLRPHSTGMLTYHDYELDGFIALDRLYNPVDTFLMGNGYHANMHEFVLLNNGHALMLAYDYQTRDLSQIIEEGDTNALVIGFIIQELDKQKDVLFQWRSWDHLEISDTYQECKSNFLDRFTICDFAHANSIDMDSDTSLIISTRNMSEITKIHRQTGEIIWRMGGKNNEFSFIDDPKSFSGQHTVIKQSNGSITLLDNGYNSDSLYSRGLEYQVDEDLKTARLVKEYHHDPQIYGFAMGNFQRLDNGNSLIFWGALKGNTSGPVTEYNPEGRVVFEAVFDSIYLSPYRCYRSEWEAEALILNVDSLHFSQTASDQYPIRSLQISNNTDKTLSINKLLSHTGNFSVNENFPLAISGGETRMIQINFHADSVGQYQDVLTFCNDTDTSRISVQLPVWAEALMVNGVPFDRAADLNIYPNPVNDLLEINSDRTIIRLEIYDIHGRLIRFKEEPGKSFSISLESAETGIFILRIYYPDGSTSRSMIMKIKGLY
ncbi:aryl-sulfate sulfotransferase [Bacteroidota bacterium]